MVILTLAFAVGLWRGLEGPGLIGWRMYLGYGKYICAAHHEGQRHGEESWSVLDRLQILADPRTSNRAISAIHGKDWARELSHKMCERVPELSRIRFKISCNAHWRWAPEETEEVTCSSKQ